MKAGFDCKPLRAAYDPAIAALIHVYERSGYREIPRPAGVVHSTMNRFYLKQL